MSISSVEKLAALLPEGVDGALVTAEYNRRYLTGFPSSAGMVLVTRGGGWFMTDFRYIEAARRVVKDYTCLEYKKAADTLNELIKKQGIRTLAVEEEGLSCAEYCRIDEMTGEVELISGVLDGLLRGMRMVKTPEQVEKIKQAQKLTDDGFQYILPRIHTGMTEREIALDLEFAIRRAGAEGVAFDFIVVSGVNSSLPHGVPSDKAVENGDFVTMDFGAMVDGWHSDMTRTVAVGSCSDEQRAVYDIVLQAQQTAQKALRPGILCIDGDAAARNVIKAAGYGDCFGHGTGHGVGIQIHEEPRLSLMSKDTLAPGHVVTVEPGIYISGQFGVRIEDMALITESGCENLTHSPHELLIVG